jgi:hypothetical protein
MRYRKAPITPPRLLLRIVGTAGAGALLGVAACSSSISSDSAPITTGIVVTGDAGGDASADAAAFYMGIGVPPPCNGCQMTTGVVAYTPDASTDGAALPGDASDDAIFNGIGPYPHDGGDAEVFYGLVANPGDAGPG